MAGQKVKLKDQLGRVVRVGSDAAGATVGEDLRWPDGTVVKPSDIRNPSADTGSTGGLAPTAWKLIREIPANIQKLAKLAGIGFTTRGGDGEWYQRSIAQGEGIAVTNGDGVVGDPTVALAELANAGGGTLQKTARDGYGRLAGTSAATTTDLSEGVNLYYTDARADARAAVAVSAHVAQPSPHPQYALDSEAIKRLGNIDQVASAAQWRLQTSRAPGACNVALRLDSGTGFNAANGAIFELNGAQEASRPGAVRVLAVAGAPITFSTGAFGLNVGAAVTGLSPTADNTHLLGSPSLRWKEAWVASGAISPSDAREKTPVRAFTPAEIAAAIELGGEIGVYQWLAMIERKGESARQHIGMTVQRAIEVMQGHGLDPFAYGFICYDEWPELPEIRHEWPAQPQVVDDFGNLVREAVDAGFEVVQEHRPAGDRYSFRMDELLAFIARGLAHRIDAVEQRLSAAGL